MTARPGSSVHSQNALQQNGNPERASRQVEMTGTGYRFVQERGVRTPQSKNKPVFNAGPEQASVPDGWGRPAFFNRSFPRRGAVF